MNIYRRLNPRLLVQAELGLGLLHWANISNIGPKLVNWHILHYGFFKGILHDIFKRSSRAYPTSNLHRASALSLREGVRDIY